MRSSGLQSLLYLCSADMSICSHFLSRFVLNNEILSLLHLHSTRILGDQNSWMQRNSGLSTEYSKCNLRVELAYYIWPHLFKFFKNVFFLALLTSIALRKIKLHCLRAKTLTLGELWRFVLRCSLRPFLPPEEITYCTQHNECGAVRKEHSDTNG